MLKYLIAAILASLALFMPYSPLHAQYEWCGYALIEGLPLLSNQLAVLEAITPRQSDQPHERFQYRFNLAGTAVIVEGCWQAAPRRELVASLLEQVVEVKPATDRAEQEVPLPTVSPLETVVEDVAVPIDVPIEPVKELTVAEYVDEELVYSLFAPGGTREESAASVRAYLAANVREWEPEGL